MSTATFAQGLKTAIGTDRKAKPAGRYARVTKVRVAHYRRDEAARALLDPTSGPSETDFARRLTPSEQRLVEHTKARVREILARKRAIAHMRDTIGR